MTASIMSRCYFENFHIYAQDTLLASRVMISCSTFQFHLIKLHVEWTQTSALKSWLLQSISRYNDNHEVKHISYWYSWMIWKCFLWSDYNIHNGIGPVRHRQNCQCGMSPGWHSQGYYPDSRWYIYTLQWRHNGRNGVSNHQPHHCLLNLLFRRRTNKTSKLRVTGHCEGNSPVSSECPPQMAGNALYVSIWWRNHEKRYMIIISYLAIVNVI